MKKIFPFFFFASFVFCHLAVGQKFKTQKTSEGLLILHGKDSVLFYQSAVKSLNGKYPRADYIHPLWNVDGSVITQDFPKDHLHHRGVFWAWHQVYVGEQRVGDAWLCEDFVWDVKKVRVLHNDARHVTFETQVDWESPKWQNKKPFVRETSLVTVFAKEKNYRILDFDITLDALAPGVRIGGSEDVKGYSGFSVRMKLPKDIKFTGENGVVTPENTAVVAGPWVDMAGSIAKNNGHGGVVVIDNPDNPMYPQKWILRSKGSMQNPAFPGTAPIVISMDKPIKLKYRLIVYTGQLAKADLQKAVKSFR